MQDARNNLATNDARAVLDLVNGKFAMSSDNYYQSKYRELMEQGYSSRIAKKAAGDMAMRYKADRMSYLNGMYNGYGVDNLVRTPFGDQIVRELALEDPVSANYYAQIQPGSKEAYQESNATARQAMNNESAMARLIQQIAGQMDQLNRSGEITRENYGYQAGVQDYYKGKEEERSVDNALRYDKAKMLQTFNLIDQYIPEEYRDGVKMALFGFTQKGNQNSKADAEVLDKSLGHMINLYKAVETRIKNLQSADEMGNNEEIQQQIAAESARLNDIYTAIESVSGISGVMPKFQVGAENDSLNQNLAKIIYEEGKARGVSDEEIRKAIYQQVLEDTSDERTARIIAGIGMNDIPKKK